MAYSDVSGLGATMMYKGKPVKGVGGFIQLAKIAKKKHVTVQSLLDKPKPKVIAKPIIGYKPPIYRPTPNIAPVLVDPGFNIGPQVDAGGSVSTPAISPTSGGGPMTSGVATPVEVGTLDSNGEIPGRPAMKLSPVALLAIAGMAFFLLKGK